MPKTLEQYTKDVIETAKTIKTETELPIDFAITLAMQIVEKHRPSAFEVRQFLREKVGAIQASNLANEVESR